MNRGQLKNLDDANLWTPPLSDLEILCWSYKNFTFLHASGTDVLINVKLAFWKFFFFFVPLRKDMKGRLACHSGSSSRHINIMKSEKLLEKVDAVFFFFRKHEPGSANTTRFLSPLQSPSGSKSYCRRPARSVTHPWSKIEWLAPTQGWPNRPRAPAQAITVRIFIFTFF